MSQKKKVIFKLIIPVILLMLIGMNVIRLNTGNINLLANKEKVNLKAISKYDTVKNSSTSIASKNCTFDGGDYSSTNPIIPSGFKPVSTADDYTVTTTWGTNTGDDGLVIEDEAGNQFVWVPVENYTELTFDYDFYELIGDLAGWDPYSGDMMSTANGYITGGKGIEEVAEISDNEEKTKSIKEYKGFYISRYELAQENGNAVSKSGKTPITEKTKSEAQTICKNLYSSNSNVGSELVGKNDWNQMVKWIFPNITKLAWINGTEKTIVAGAGETINLEEVLYPEDEGNVSLDLYGIDSYESLDGNFDDIYGLSATGDTGYNNIYDLVGNVAEYIEADDNIIYEIGGAYTDDPVDWPSCNSNSVVGRLEVLNTYLTDPEKVTESTDLSTVGFRNVLYVLDTTEIYIKTSKVVDGAVAEDIDEDGIISSYDNKLMNVFFNLDVPIDGETVELTEEMSIEIDYINSLRDGDNQITAEYIIERCDINDDGIIDINDYAAFGGKYNENSIFVEETIGFRAQTVPEALNVVWSVVDLDENKEETGTSQNATINSTTGEFEAIDTGYVKVIAKVGEKSQHTIIEIVDKPYIRTNQVVEDATAIDLDEDGYVTLYDLEILNLFWRLNVPTEEETLDTANSQNTSYTDEKKEEINSEVEYLNSFRDENDQITAENLIKRCDLKQDEDNIIHAADYQIFMSKYQNGETYTGRKETFVTKTNSGNIVWSVVDLDENQKETGTNERATIDSSTGAFEAIGTGYVKVKATYGESSLATEELIINIVTPEVCIKTEELVDEAIVGDINKDGLITRFDVNIMIKLNKGDELTDEESGYLDLDGDGTVAENEILELCDFDGYGTFGGSDVAYALRIMNGLEEKVNKINGGGIINFDIKTKPKNTEVVWSIVEVTRTDSGNGTYTVEEIGETDIATIDASTGEFKAIETGYVKVIATVAGVTDYTILEIVETPYIRANQVVKNAIPEDIDEDGYFTLYDFEIWRVFIFTEIPAEGETLTQTEEMKNVVTYLNSFRDENNKITAEYIANRCDIDEDGSVTSADFVLLNMKYQNVETYTGRKETFVTKSNSDNIVWSVEDLDENKEEVGTQTKATIDPATGEFEAIDTGYVKVKARYKESSLATEELIINILDGTFNIAYELDNGTNNSSNPTTYEYGTEVILKEPSKTGYTFAGWYDNSSYAGTAITKIDATQTGDITLYAKWTINTSKLTVNPNGGSVSITSPTGGTAEAITSSKTYTQNYNTTLTYGKPTKADTSADTKYVVTYNYNGNGESNKAAEATRTVVTSYTFSGWTKSSTFYGTLSSTTGNGTYTYPANKDVTSTITANYTSSTKSDTTTSVKLPTPERGGYTFKGWYTQASGGTKVGEGGANYTPTGNVTIYAQWEINSYKLTINYVYADESGVLEKYEDTVEYNSAYSVSTPKIAGYTADKEVVTGTMGAGDVEVTVTFAANTNTSYEVEHYKENLKGEYEETADEIDNLTGTTNTETLAEAKTYEGFTAGKVTQSTIAGDGSTVVKIYYTRNSYELVYKVDGVQYGETESYKYGQSVIVKEIPTKTGYTFSGWAGTVESMPAKAVEVTGTFTINSYTITFDTDGGSNVEPITQDYGSTVTAPIDPTKEGYTFAGWDKAVPETMPAEDITIKAEWEINKYTITFNTDGGSDVETIIQDYGSTITAPSNPTKEGYTFAGWDKEIPETMPAENITITAQWNANGDTPYKIEYYVENITKDGYELKESIELLGTTDTQVMAIEKEYPGFILDKEVEGTILSGKVKADGSLALKVYYERNIYQIIYNLNEGTNNIENPSTYIYGTEVELKEPRRTGYSFKGWYDNSNYEGSAITKIEVTQTGDITLYAQWTINSYKLTINYVYADESGVLEKYEDTVEYNSAYSVVTPEVAGYTADKEVVAGTMGAGDVEVTVTFAANTNTSYKVEHYKENLNGEYEETADETDNLTGTTGLQTVAVAKTYEGFTAGKVTQSTIAGDGSTVVKIYYTRNSYNLIYKVDGVQYGETESYKYQEPVEIKEVPTKEGYTFSGWSRTVETMPAENLIITAQWKEDKNGNGEADEDEEKYIVIWKDYDETTVLEKDENVLSGTMPSYDSEAPTREGYIFVGWTPEVEKVTGNAEYIATYNIDETKTKEVSYTVEYYKDGELDEEAVQTVTKEVQVLETTLEVDKAQINITNKYPGYKFDRTEPEEIPDRVKIGSTIKVYYVERQVADIEVTKAPEKTEYKAGESFEQAGMEITATYDNGDTRILEETEYKIEIASPLTVKDTKVSIIYKANDEIGTQLEIMVNKAEGEKNPAYIESLKELEKIGILEITYYEGMKLKDIGLPENWEWKEPDTNLDANEEGEVYIVIYHSQDENYEDVEVGIIIKIRKAIPKYEMPEEIETIKGQTLGEIKEKLPEGYEFMDALDTKVGEVGYREFKVKYTPQDTKNYQVVENITVMVHVVEGNIPVAEITVVEEMRLVVGGKVKLTADIVPVEATNKEVKWRSSNEEIIVVDGKGNVEAKGVGIAYVIVETVEGGKTASCRIEVIEKTYEVEETEEGIYVSGINPNTTKEIFEEKFPTIYRKEIYNQEGRKIEEGEIIGTGYTLKLYDGETLKEEINLIVKGDVTGEGTANYIDSGKIIYHRLGKELLEGVFKKAADINRDGIINGQDSTILIYHRLQMDGYEWEN